MPRKWTTTVADFPRPRDDRPYRVLVTSVAKAPKGDGAVVIVRHVDTDQAGREHTVTLPLPVRPAGLTAEFFRACGLELAVGGTVHPCDAVGRTVAVRLSVSAAGDPKVISFEAPNRENHDDVVTD